MPIGFFAAKPAASTADAADGSPQHPPLAGAAPALVRFPVARRRCHRRLRGPADPCPADVTSPVEHCRLGEICLLEITPFPAPVDHQERAVCFECEERMVPHIAMIVYPLRSSREKRPHAAWFRPRFAMRHHDEIILLPERHETLRAERMP